MVLLTSVRGEIIRQNETVVTNNHKRNLEKAELVSKYGLSVLSLFTGAFLVYSGIIWAGLLIVGAGLYNIAPKYVMTALRAYVKGDKDDQGL
ncbi:MAG: hypothetical protein HOP19_02040 [Acidobacteria bacterium]|nr:hypothetical protein [Acidobacteriota bacterium]